MVEVSDSLIHSLIHSLTHSLTHLLTHSLVGHIEHHAETLDDMSLRTDARWLVSPASKLLSSDPYRGTAFSWSVTGLMFLQMIATTLPVLFYLLKFSLSNALLIIAPSLLLHVSIWNCLHPNMHYLPGPQSLLLTHSITCAYSLTTQMFLLNSGPQANGW